MEQISDRSPKEKPVRKNKSRRPSRPANQEKPLNPDIAGPFSYEFGENVNAPGRACLPDRLPVGIAWRLG